MLFYYVRHGDPIYNPDSLTPFGHEQAAALAERFAVHGLDRIYSSDSTRAQMTAQPTAERLGLTPTIVPWANEGRPWERMCVIYENGHRVYVFEDPQARRAFVSDEVYRMRDEWDKHPLFRDEPFGQCYRDIGADADAFFESLGYKHDRENHVYIPVDPTEERVALFAHQAFGMAFLSNVLDIPYPLFCTHFDTGHSGVTAIEFREQDGVVIPCVLQLSNDSHLFKADISTRYQNRLDI